MARSSRARVSPSLGRDSGRFASRRSTSPDSGGGRSGRSATSGGGLPIRVGGQLIGGIGVSGASEAQDEDCARAALAAGVGRFVHCSSIHSFDQYHCGGKIDENSPRSADPAIPVYDRSKWAGEQELRTVVDELNQAGQELDTAAEVLAEVPN